MIKTQPWALQLLHTIQNTRITGQEFHSPLESRVMEFDPYEH